MLGVRYIVERTWQDLFIINQNQVLKIGLGSATWWPTSSSSSHVVVFTN